MSLPRLEGVTWRVDAAYSSSSLAAANEPVLRLCLTVRDQPAWDGAMPGARDVAVALGPASLGALLEGMRRIKVRKGVTSVEMEDLFLATSVFQVRDKFPTKEELDELETMKGEAESQSPAKKTNKETRKQEEKIKYTNFSDPYREQDVGREFEARLRSNAVEPAFNVVNGTYVSRVKDVEGLVKVSVKDPRVDVVPAPWIHGGADSGEFVGKNDFKRYSQNGPGSAVDPLRSGNTGHLDLWR